jgi:hypothetical protein
MCCEVSYLYIELLTQPSYLTYVGFLNMEIFNGHLIVGGMLPTFSLGKGLGSNPQGCL